MEWERAAGLVLTERVEVLHLLVSEPGQYDDHVGHLVVCLDKHFG